MEISEVWVTFTKLQPHNHVALDTNITRNLTTVGSPNGQSVVISPYSFSAILMLLMMGANGRTKSQMSSAFFPRHRRHHFKPNHLFRMLDSVLPPPRKGIGFNLQNEIFIDRKCILNETLEQEAKKYFDVTIRRKNFHHNPIGSVAGINRWIKRYTKRKFDNLITPDMITKNTIAVFLNAMTFNMKWKKKFHPVTGAQDFNVSKNDTVPLTMIRSIQKARYGKFNAFEVLVLPLKGKQLNLVVILPENPETLPEFEAMVTMDALHYLKKSTKFNNIDITLPKLFLKNKINLKDYLPKIGVKRIFNTIENDFNNLFKGHKRIYVSGAVHNVVTKMNGVQKTLIEPSKAENNPFRRFIADKPFLFYIIQNVNKKDSVVIFMGRYIGN